LDKEQEGFVELTADVISYFGCGGRGADRDFVGVGLLDGDAGELGGSAGE
jgi:hypothetical protein